IASSFRDLPLSARDIYLGEIGLTGEIRQIPRLFERLKEAQNHGFQRALVPPKSLALLEKGGDKRLSMEIIPVHTVREALEVAFQ
ncbi:MAG: DNA repair protein RadA, partial [Candidatus Carbobacillus sp.]|nr:DNA repair protein RadA [Candidatus Carbobacillus sp.]